MSTQNQASKKYSCRLLVIGLDGSGKTTLLENYKV